MDHEQANRDLEFLYAQTGDPTIRRYIDSGWTSEVAPGLLGRVRSILEQYGFGGWQPNPVTDFAGGETFTRDPREVYRRGTGSSAATFLPPRATPKVPSLTLPSMAGGNESPVDGNGGGSDLPVGGGGYGGLGGAASGTGYGYEGPPQGYGLTNPTPYPASGPTPGRGTPTPTPPPAQPIGTHPAGGTTVNPLTGMIDPNSALGQQGYADAANGDQGALGLVMGKLLKSYGIDVTRPGMTTKSIVRSLQPYLQTFLRYYGLDSGKPTEDKLRGIADEFGRMIGSAGSFGQIQDFARNTLGGATDVMRDPQGLLADPDNQMGMANDLLGMLQAGNNAISQQSNLGKLQGLNYDYSTLGTLDEPGLTYGDFLRRQAATGKLPGGDLLAQILGAMSGGR